MNKPKIKQLIVNMDTRGVLVEMLKFKHDGQVYYSITPPNITRGNHYHKHKIESFIVIKGVARIVLQKGTTRYTITVSDNDPRVITIPPMWVHNITNIGKTEMILIAHADKLYNKRRTDTYPLRRSRPFRCSRPSCRLPQTHRLPIKYF